MSRLKFASSYGVYHSLDLLGEGDHHGDLAGNAVSEKKKVVSCEALWGNCCKFGSFSGYFLIGIIWWNVINMAVTNVEFVNFIEVCERRHCEF